MKKLILLLITIASLSGCAKEVVEVEKKQPENEASTENAYTITGTSDYQFTAYFKSIDSDLLINKETKVNKSFDTGIEEITIKNSIKGANFVIKYKNTSAAVYRRNNCTLIVTFSSFTENSKVFYKITVKDK